MSQIIRWDGWISVTLPTGWECEVDDESKVISVFDPLNGVGALQFSFQKLTPPVADVQDHTVRQIQVFIKGYSGQDAILEAIEVHGVWVAHTQFKTPDDYWEGWVLSDGVKQVFITYNCALEDEGVERETYQRIVSSVIWL